MFIDWERTGPERRFEVRVPNVSQAGQFYRDVFGAQETFRQEAHNGRLFRFGLAIGGVGFAISSEDDIEQERPLLSSIAEDFGSTFVAIILRVEDRDRMARAAVNAGSGITRAHELDPVTVITDLFGGYWASIQREPAP
jgi:uncharacterized glyoxalase superfamily protein PhnB